VEGMIVDDKEKPCIQVIGKWNESIFGKLSKNYAPNINVEPTDSIKLQEFKKQLKKCLYENDPLWIHTLKPLDSDKLGQYQIGWTKFTLEIADVNDEMRAHLPPTDSRLRADRYYLERSDTKRAASEKYALEEKQREQRRQREAKKEEWAPKYFKKFMDERGDFCEYTGGYFEERENRFKAASEAPKEAPKENVEAQKNTSADLISF